MLVGFVEVDLTLSPLSSQSLQKTAAESYVGLYCLYLTRVSVFDCYIMSVMCCKCVLVLKYFLLGFYIQKYLSKVKVLSDMLKYKYKYIGITFEKYLYFAPRLMHRILQCSEIL